MEPSAPGQGGGRQRASTTASHTSVRSHISQPPETNNRSRTPSRASTPTRPPVRLRASSVAIRRLSQSSVPGHRLRTPSAVDISRKDEEEDVGTRKRSLSAPQRPQLGLVTDGPTDISRQRTVEPYMPTLQESEPIAPPPQSALRRTLTGQALRRRLTAPPRPDLGHEYDSEVVDFLEVVDPQVGTLTTLTNVQNSLFVPDLGRLLNRRPTYDLGRTPSTTSSSSEEDETTDTDTTEAEVAKQQQHYEPIAGPRRAPTTEEERAKAQEEEEHRAKRHSITSSLSESYYAVLPHGVSIADWSEEDKQLLNDHVRHMLHSKRSKFARSMRGFGQYVRKPLGFLVTLYAVCITAFGLVWVLLLIGWISGGGEDRHKYLINVVDNVLVALFAVVGDGLAPFRAVDTYHMCFIAHYAHLTWELRKQKHLPELHNHNDLPTELPEQHDIEHAALPPEEKEDHELSVLTEKQQKRLEYHQRKFAKSHTFYKPHETTTHYAFPVRLLIAIVVLLDCHSMLQISLGACTWGINYKVRPATLTTVILVCSISCNTLAGVLIMIGDRRSRKKEVVERMMRQSLTEEAMRKVKRKKDREVRRMEKHRREAEEAERKRLEEEERNGGVGVRDLEYEVGDGAAADPEKEMEVENGSAGESSASSGEKGGRPRLSCVVEERPSMMVERNLESVEEVNARREKELAEMNERFPEL